MMQVNPSNADRIEEVSKPLTSLLANTAIPDMQILHNDYCVYHLGPIIRMMPASHVAEVTCIAELTADVFFLAHNRMWPASS